VAHPYSTVEQLRAQEGAARALALIDFDEDGSEDVGVAATGNVAPIDAAIADADDEIDARLGARYSVPFASLTSTPRQVTKLSVTGTLAQLYERLAPDSADAKKYRKEFDESCERYRTGDWVIPGATLLDSEDRYRSVTVESTSPVFAGREDDDYTDTGVDRARGM
jgi:phage gp36-like protein